MMVEEATERLPKGSISKGHEDTKTGRQEDMKTGRQKDRRKEDKERKRLVGRGEE